MMLLAVLASCVMQDPIDAVAASESRRVAVIARCAQAVCSVMSMDSPGGGSGVIFDPAGFVLTNYHVVGKPDKGYKLKDAPEPSDEVVEAWRKQADGGEDEEDKFIAEWQAEWRAEHQSSGASHYKNKKIGLPDGKLYEGVVLGIDPGSDLAVIRLLPKEEGQTWPYCELGNSDALLVGETVLAGDGLHADGHVRHRFRHAPLPRRPRQPHVGLPGLHPGGRAGQPRQLGWSTVQRSRRCDRHQWPHLDR
jgi:hypothetical protein